MIVKQSTEHLEKSQVALTITIDSKSIEEAYTKRLQKYQKELTIDGFRKGKTPISVLEKKYGDAIREESTFSLLDDSLEEALKEVKAEDKPLPYATPTLQDAEKLLPFKKDEDVTFTVVYDVKPSFDLKEYKGLEILVEGAEVKDSDVDDEIERIRETNAIVRTKDGAVESGDIANIDYVELDENGAEKSDTERKGFTFTVGTHYNYYMLDNDIIGMKKGDEKIIEKTYSEEETTGPLKGTTVKLKVVVNEVKKRELPELDDDFAQDVKEEYKTMDDLRKATKEKLEKELEDALKNIKLQTILEKLISETEITLPESMVQSQLNSSWRDFASQSGLDEATLAKFMEMQGETKESILEKWREGTEKDLKGQLILDAIKNKENFVVDEEEFNKACEAQLKNVPDENKDFYKEMLKDDMQFSMAGPFLIENNTFKNSGEIKSYKEFFNK